ncbi:MAG TPA: hypothetical protein VGF48_23410 [Thermoanaerobaculia bacterium]
MRKLVICFALLACASSAVGQSNVTVTARLSESRVLPALPVDIEFVVQNRSSQPFTLPDAFTMEVTPEGGQPSLARWVDMPLVRWATLDPLWDGNTTVAPRETRTIRWSSWLAGSDGLGVHPLPITTPGSYQLRFAFGSELEKLLDHHSPSEAKKSRNIDDLQRWTTVWVTNTVPLVVEEPGGIDTVVRQKMQEAADGPEWPGSRRGMEFARDLWTNHRDSRYAPFATVTLWQGASSERVRQLRDELRKLDPRHPNIEWLELREARRLLLEAGNMVGAGAPLNDINRYEALAEKLYQNALKSSKNGDIILAARAGLADVAEQRKQNAYDFEYYKGLPRRQLQPVKPLVACGKVSDHETHVVFAYDNPNKHTVQIPIGNRNMFEPGDMDRGQPMMFEPGRNEQAFRVKAKNGGPLTWHLDGNVLSVDPGKIRQCSDSAP